MVNYVIVDTRHLVKTTDSDGLSEPVFTHPPLLFLLNHMVWFGSGHGFYFTNRIEPQTNTHRYIFALNKNQYL